MGHLHQHATVNQKRGTLTCRDSPVLQMKKMRGRRFSMRMFGGVSHSHDESKQDTWPSHDFLNQRAGYAAWFWALFISVQSAPICTPGTWSGATAVIPSSVPGDHPTVHTPLIRLNRLSRCIGWDGDCMKADLQEIGWWSLWCSIWI